MRICFCADVHISQNSNISELIQCFDTMISQCDLLVIGGDIMDSKSYTSSEAVSTLIELFDFIFPVIRAQKKSVRLIYGTQSHDSYPQLQILQPYTCLMDFKIYQHVTEETIHGYKILFMPEEIIYDKNEYYQDTLYSNQYDYIFGHGVVAEGMAMVKPAPKNTKSVPIFKTEELQSHAKYHVCFGHFHVHWDSGRVHYVGSLSRFRHGEETPKGWFILQNRQITFVENELAPNYAEHKIQCNEYSPSDLSTFIINTVNQFQESKSPRDKLKFTFYSDRDQETMEIIRSHCKGEGVSYQVKDMSTAVIESDIIEDEYSYILDQSIPIQDKIIKYNKQQFSGDINTELLDRYVQQVKGE